MYFTHLFLFAIANLQHFYYKPRSVCFHKICIFDKIYVLFYEKGLLLRCIILLSGHAHQKSKQKYTQKNEINCFFTIHNISIFKKKKTETDWLVIGGLCHIISNYFDKIHKQNDETLQQPYQDLLNFAKQQSLDLCKRHLASWDKSKENHLLPLFLYQWQASFDIIKQQSLYWQSLPLLNGLLAEIPTR